MPLRSPEDAETVRAIFARYLKLGSIGPLAEDLDRSGIRTKQRRVRFGVGALAYLLKNRIYIGEVVYRGEVHRGEHDSILDRDVFEAAQTKLAAGTVERRLRLKTSPAVLTGRIFDDCGNRMSPTHSNKLGARYRYYVSHAVIAKRRKDAGSIARVPAPEIETLVLKAVREHLQAIDNAEHQIAASDRDLIDRHVERIVVKPNVIEVQLIDTKDEPTTPGDQNHRDGMGEDRSDPRPFTLALSSKLQRREGRSPRARGLSKLEVRAARWPSGPPED